MYEHDRPEKLRAALDYLFHAPSISPATFAVGRSPPSYDVSDVGGGLGPAVFDGGLEGVVVAVVLVGVFLGEVGDRLVEFG